MPRSKKTLEAAMQDANDFVLRQMQALSEFTDRLEYAKYRASFDALTGLDSRGKGEAWLGACLEAGKPTAVLLIDLDCFKQINIRFGHRCGDQILKSVGQRLAESAEEFDVISRWDGDKFLMIAKSNAINLEEKASMLRIQLGQPYRVSIDDDSVDVSVGVSVGVAQATPTETPDQFLRRAEDDLYRNRSVSRELSSASQ
jgi:diguanylate cyclase (GGDEF)-like protein